MIPEKTIETMTTATLIFGTVAMWGFEAGLVEASVRIGVPAIALVAGATTIAVAHHVLAVFHL